MMLDVEASAIFTILNVLVEQIVIEITNFFKIRSYQRGEITNLDFCIEKATKIQILTFFEDE